MRRPHPILPSRATDVSRAEDRFAAGARRLGFFSAAFLAVSLLLLGGCGRDGGLRPPLVNGGTGEVPTYTEDVAPIIQASCSCHLPGGVEYGRTKLDTYERVSALGERVRVRAGILGSMPPTGPLQQEQRQTIIAWAEGGTPR
jgi:hypothetical protein